MLKINTTKILILAVIISVLAPIISIVAISFIKPDFYEYSLSYVEVPSEENKGKTPIALVFCFEVPSDLELEGDLQDYLVSLTKNDLKTIMATEETGIDQLRYKTSEGCEGGYSVRIKADDVEKGYAIYKKGDL